MDQSVMFRKWVYTCRKLLFFLCENLTINSEPGSQVYRLLLIRAESFFTKIIEFFTRSLNSAWLKIFLKFFKI